MQASVFIVHRDDGLVRAMTRLLLSARYDVRHAERVDALREELERAPRPAVLIVDDDADPAWRDALGSVPRDVPRVILTWYPRETFPPGVTPIGKPFVASELLDVLSRTIAARAPDADLR